MKLKPNHLTFAALVLGVIAVFMPLIPALVLFTASFVLDVLDGRLARKKKMSSQFGGFFDSVSDKIVEVIFIYYITTFMNVTQLGSLLVGSSLLTSYMKHRANLKIKIKSALDRPERMIYFLLTTLIYFFTNSYAYEFLSWFLLINSFSQIELFFRIKRMLK